jgi:hypothetical protein
MIAVGVISAVLAIVLLFLSWWFCIRGRGRSNYTGAPSSGIAHGSLIDDADHPLDKYDRPQMLRPAASHAALPRPRIQLGRQQPLSPPLSLQC